MSASKGANIRAYILVSPPGRNGTMIVTGRVGQSPCAGWVAGAYGSVAATRVTRVAGAVLTGLSSVRSGAAGRQAAKSADAMTMQRNAADARPGSAFRPFAGFSVFTVGNLRFMFALCRLRAKMTIAALSSGDGTAYQGKLRDEPHNLAKQRQQFPYPSHSLFALSDRAMVTP